MEATAIIGKRRLAFIKHMQKNILKIFILISATLPIAGFASPSSVSLYPASNITENSATLSGVAVLGNEGLKNIAYFRYAKQYPAPVFCKDIYGSNMISTKDIVLGTGNGSTHAFSQDIAGLEPDTKYYYCAIVSDKKLITYLNNTVGSFVTKPCQTCGQTTIATEYAFNVNNTWANLKAAYNNATSSGGAIYFEYSDDYTKVVQGVGTLTVNIQMQANKYDEVAKKITNLTPGKTYYYRAWAKLGSQKLRGSIFSFTTLGQTSSADCPPGTPITYDPGYGGPVIPPTPSNPCPPTNSPGTGPIDTTGGGTTTNTGGGIVSPTGSGITGPGTVGGTYGPETGLIISNGPNGSVNVTNNGIDIVVRYHEGVEHVFQRQIIGIPSLARLYGYQTGMDMNLFSADTAHFLAGILGYVDNMGKEVRVSYPDVAAYELKMQSNGSIIVNEYLLGVLIESRQIKPILKTPPHDYEYYYRFR